MPTYSVGEVIKYLRTKKGISQEQLCSGLCSVATISKVERGVQVLSKYNFDAIMQRLGENAENYFSVFVGAEDFETFQLKQQMQNSLFLGNFSKSEELISVMEESKNFQTGLNLQFLLAAKSGILKNNIKNNQLDKENYTVAFQLLMQAIKITIPYFDEKDISTYLLTDEEAEIINMMATTYHQTGNSEIAIEILYNLKKSLESSFVDFKEKANRYTLVLYNLSKYLGLAGRFSETIEISEIGRKACIKANKAHLLPMLIFNKAYALNAIGDIASCERLLKQAYYGLDALENFSDAGIVRDYANEKFGIVL